MRLTAKSDVKSLSDTEVSYREQHWYEYLYAESCPDGSNCVDWRSDEIVTVNVAYLAAVAAMTAVSSDETLLVGHYVHDMFKKIVDQMVDPDAPFVLKAKVIMFPFVIKDLLDSGKNNGVVPSYYMLSRTALLNSTEFAMKWLDMNLTDPMLAALNPPAPLATQFSVAQVIASASSFRDHCSCTCTSSSPCMCLMPRFLCVPL
jgi:hypothetical protein